MLKEMPKLRLSFGALDAQCLRPLLNYPLTACYSHTTGALPGAWILSDGEEAWHEWQRALTQL